MTVLESLYVKGDIEEASNKLDEIEKRAWEDLYRGMPLESN